MAIKGDGTYDDSELADTIRRRIRQQSVDPSMDPTVTRDAADSQQPTPSAPFAEPKVETPGTAVATQPAAPAPPAAFSGGGGPPQPQDPYYAAYGAEHPGANTAAPIGPQINYDNTPITTATSGPTSNFNAGQVANWWNAANPTKPFNATYWESVWPSLVARGQQLGDPDYPMKRVMGYGAGPQDFATAGPYANGQGYAQPGAPAQTSFGSPAGGSAQYTGGGNALTQSVGLSVPQGVWSPDFVAQLRAMLMDRLRAASAPVDPNSPEISQPLAAARDEANRASEKERTDLAENLYAHGGLNTDALSQALQQSGERTAIGLGTLRGTLIQRQIESQKNELRDLLQMSLAAGDAQGAREIQAQIAALNAILQREGYGVQLAMNETNQNRYALGV